MTPRGGCSGRAKPIEGEGSAANNASVVLVVEVSGVSMLLTGDVEPEAQRAILCTTASQTSTCSRCPITGRVTKRQQFLEASGAAVALVSVGEDNNYGHPDPDLLASLKQRGMLVARTDSKARVAVIAERGGASSGGRRPDGVVACGRLGRSHLTC